jgi:hypothetical protein
MPPKGAASGGGSSVGASCKLAILNHPFSGIFPPKDAYGEWTTAYPSWCKKQYFMYVSAKLMDPGAKCFWSFRRDSKMAHKVKATREMFEIFCTGTYTSSRWADNMTFYLGEGKQRQITTVSAVPSKLDMKPVGYLFAASHAVSDEESLEGQAEPTLDADIDYEDEKAVRAAERALAAAKKKWQKKIAVETFRDPGAMLAAVVRANEAGTSRDAIGIKIATSFKGDSSVVSSQPAFRRRGGDDEEGLCKLFKNLKIDQWKNRANMYNPRGITKVTKDKDGVVAPLHRTDSPYHWDNVYTLEAAIDLMKADGAHADFLNPLSYNKKINEIIKDHGLADYGDIQPPLDEGEVKLPPMDQEEDGEREPGDDELEGYNIAPARAAAAAVPRGPVIDEDSGTRTWSYPMDGKFTWRYEPSCNEPNRMRCTEFPDLHVDDKGHLPVGPELEVARDHYNASIEPGEPTWEVDTSWSELNPIHRDIALRIATQCSGDDSGRNAFTLPAFYARSKARMKEIWERKDVDGIGDDGILTAAQIAHITNTKHREIGLSYKEIVEDFFNVLRQDNMGISEPHAAHAQYYDDHRAKKMRVSFPMDSYEFANLSPFGNMKAREMVDLELGAGAYCCHTAILRLKDAVTSVPIGEGMRFHVILTGDPGTGKSFALELVYCQMAVKGTAVKATTQSEKAFYTANCRKLNGVAKMFEEAPPNLFGISNKSLNSQKGATVAGDSANTPEAAAFRDLMTSQVVVYDRQVTDKITGISETQTFVIDAQMQVSAACNADFTNFPAATRSRNSLVEMLLINRLDILMAHKNSKVPDEHSKKLLARWIEQSQRDQFLIFVISNLVKAGVVPPVNESVTAPLITSMHEAMSARGVAAASENRPMQRIRLLIQNACITEAIHTALDGPWRILRGDEREWDWSIIQHIQRFMVASVDHLVWAYTMCADEFESSLRQAISVGLGDLIEKAGTMMPLTAEERKAASMATEAKRKGAVPKSKQMGKQKHGVEGGGTPDPNRNYMEASPISVLTDPAEASNVYGLDNLHPDFAYIRMPEIGHRSMDRAHDPTHKRPLARFIRAKLGIVTTDERVMDILGELQDSKLDFPDPNPINLTIDNSKCPVIRWLVSNDQKNAVVRIARSFLENGSVSIVESCLRDILSPQGVRRMPIAPGIERRLFVTARASPQVAYRLKCLQLDEVPMVDNPGGGPRKPAMMMLPNLSYTNPECEAAIRRSLGPYSSAEGKSESGGSLSAWEKLRLALDRQTATLPALVFDNTETVCAYSYGTHRNAWPLFHTDDKLVDHKERDISLLCSNPELFYYKELKKRVDEKDPSFCLYEDAEVYYKAKMGPKEQDHAKAKMRDLCAIMNASNPLAFYPAFPRPAAMIAARIPPPVLKQVDIHSYKFDIANSDVKRVESIQAAETKRDSHGIPLMPGEDSPPREDDTEDKENRPPLIHHVDHHPPPPHRPVSLKRPSSAAPPSVPDKRYAGASSATSLSSRPASVPSALVHNIIRYNLPPSPPPALRSSLASHIHADDEDEMREEDVFGLGMII